MSVLVGLVEKYKKENLNNTLDYQDFIDSLSPEKKEELFKEIEVLNEDDVKDLKDFFKDMLQIELSNEFVKGFLKEYPELACIVVGGNIYDHFEQDYIRSLFCFYIGVPPWPLAVFDAEKKESFFKALIERSIMMNFSFVKQVEA